MPQLGRECDSRFSPFLSCRLFPTELMEYSSDNQRITQAKRMRELLSESERLVISLPCLVGITEQQQNPRRKRKAPYPGVYPPDGEMRAEVLMIEESDPLLCVRAGRGQLSQGE